MVSLRLIRTTSTQIVPDGLLMKTTLVIPAMNPEMKTLWKLFLLHKHRFGDKGKDNDWQCYIKTGILKTHDRYQKLLQKYQIYLIKQKSKFPIN